MPSFNRLVFPVVAVFSLAFLVGCGSGRVRATPPPTGAFANSNLKGTYVFSVAGSDALGNLVAMAGTLTADGNGSVTAGLFDVNNPNGAGWLPGITIKGGSIYKVTVDGRGIATLQTSQGVFVFDFVLTSSEHGLITEFDSSGTGSGSLDLQGTVTQGGIAGSYAFNLSGTSGVGTNICGFSNGVPVAVPIATVGAFTLDASGNVTAGVEDFNNNCNSTSVTNLAITSGSVSLAAVPGTATITTSSGTFNFHVYPIDAAHLKFIEADSVPVMAGDAFTQSPAISTGANVFTLAGFDTVIGGPFAAAGLIMTDGAGNVTSSPEDINDAGSGDSQATFTGSYTALSGGRSVLTLNTFNNGGNGLAGTFHFAVYPSSGGLQVLEIDNAGVTAGVAYPQTATSVAAGQGYGLNLTGSNSSGEEDDIAEFTNTNQRFTGIVDLNDQGALTSNRSFGATYTPDTTVSGRGTVTSSVFNLVTYVVDSSTAVFVEVDNNPPQVGLGAFGLQNASAKSNPAASHLVMLRVKPGAKGAWRSR